MPRDASARRSRARTISHDRHCRRRRLCAAANAAPARRAPRRCTLDPTHEYCPPGVSPGCPRTAMQWNLLRGRTATPLRWPRPAQHGAAAATRAADRRRHLVLRGGRRQRGAHLALNGVEGERGNRPRALCTRRADARVDAPRVRRRRRSAGGADRHDRGHPRLRASGRTPGTDTGCGVAQRLLRRRRRSAGGRGRGPRQVSGRRHPGLFRGRGSRRATSTSRTFSQRRMETPPRVAAGSPSPLGAAT